MPETRRTLAAIGLRRHGERLGRHADRRSAHDRSCYVLGDAGFDGFGAGRFPARPGQRDVHVTGRVPALREALVRRTAVPDAELDQLFPEELRERSDLHWTPVAIALRAAALLAPSPDTRVLDIGAGVGKLCVIGALATGATWWGIEHDPVLVGAAQHAAWALDIGSHTRFVVGDGSQLAWDDFDAIYFYNPFGTPMLAPEASPFVRHATVERTLRRIEQRLAAARPGTRVVTYHGFGGTLPDGYTLISREPAGDGALELWVREAR